jgi:glycine oxidase
VLLAPLTGELLAQSLMTGELPEWARAFSPLRMAGPLVGAAR